MDVEEEDLGMQVRIFKTRKCSVHTFVSFLRHCSILSTIPLSYSDSEFLLLANKGRLFIVKCPTLPDAE